MLEEALEAFPGTVLAVSHDRYFLRRIATRVLELRGGRLQDYSGDYEAYLSKNAGAAERAAVAEDRARAVANSQVVAKSKMTRAEKEMEKEAKEKAKKQKAREFNAKAAGK
jgi:ATPase subunit of ABC transporter with duplicated ATPase domains